MTIAEIRKCITQPNMEYEVITKDDPTKKIRVRAPAFHGQPNQLTLVSFERIEKTEGVKNMFSEDEIIFFKEI